MDSIKGKAIGFRSWTLIDSYERIEDEFSGEQASRFAVDPSSSLLAPINGHSPKFFDRDESDIWLPGVNKSVCRGIHTGAETPAADCHCGYNAFNTLRGAQGYRRFLGGSSKVFGAVAGYGKLQIHRDGWRSEYAEIIALYLPRHKKEDPEIQRIADNYGVPLFRSRRKFIRYTKQFAQRVPRSLRPNFYSGFVKHSNFNTGWLAVLVVANLLKVADISATINSVATVFIYLSVAAIWSIMLFLILKK